MQPLHCRLANSAVVQQDKEQEAHNEVGNEGTQVKVDLLRHYFTGDRLGQGVDSDDVDRNRLGCGQRRGL